MAFFFFVLHYFSYVRWKYQCALKKQTNKKKTDVTVKLHATKNRQSHTVLSVTTLCVVSQRWAIWLAEWFVMDNLWQLHLLCGQWNLTSHHKNKEEKKTTSFWSWRKIYSFLFCVLHSPSNWAISVCNSNPTSKYDDSYLFRPLHQKRKLGCCFFVIIFFFYIFGPLPCKIEASLQNNLCSQPIHVDTSYASHYIY